MATPKKKHLIELMIEAGVKWPDGAEYAAQDKRDNKVFFFDKKPTVMNGDAHYSAEGGTVCHSIPLPSLCRNWHQTIVTREQYETALVDAEMWSAWMDTSHIEEKSNQAQESNSYPAVAHAGCFSWNDAPSIEQLTADYHAKAAEAQRLKSVADEALKSADDALLALEKAGELIGLIISVDAKQNEAVQPVISDWRDLRVGDVIIIDHVDCDSVRKDALQGVESVIVSDGEEYPICVTNEKYPVGESWYLGGPSRTKFRFIRRP